MGCDYEYDLRHLLIHIATLLHSVEEDADEDDMRRIIEDVDYHSIEEDDECNDPEYIHKWNAIFTSIGDFTKMVSDRLEIAYQEERKREKELEKQKKELEKQNNELENNNTEK